MCTHGELINQNRERKQQHECKIPLETLRNVERRGVECVARILWIKFCSNYNCFAIYYINFRQYYSPKVVARHD